MGFFNEPHGVAALPWGEIAVSDTYNNRVQIFDQNGGLRAPELTPLRKRDINLSLSLYPPLRVFPIPLCVKFRSLSVQGHFACAYWHTGANPAASSFLRSPAGYYCPVPRGAIQPIRVDIAERCVVRSSALPGADAFRASCISCARITGDIG